MTVLEGRQYQGKRQSEWMDDMNQWMEKDNLQLMKMMTVDRNSHITKGHQLLPSVKEDEQPMIE